MFNHGYSKISNIKSKLVIVNFGSWYKFISTQGYLIKKQKKTKIQDNQTKLIIGKSKKTKIVLKFYTKIEKKKMEIRPIGIISSVYNYLKLAYKLILRRLLSLKSK